jgi:hypothetical protein
MKVVIDRSKWIRGKLADEHGCMCAMGFIAKACGVPDSELVGATSLACISDALGHLPGSVPDYLHPRGCPEQGFEESDSARVIEAINDNEVNSTPEIEAILTGQVRWLDIELEFTGESMPYTPGHGR